MSTEYLTPTTELEAVNQILYAIGEAPVGTLSGALPTDAAIALQRLRDTSRAFQSAGWSFNTDYGYTLAKDNDGKVPLPRNALSVDPTDDLDIVPRGGFLYDRRNHTFILDRNVKVDIVRFLPFDDLPEPARQYLLATTGRQFSDRLIGDESNHSFTELDERRAWANFLNAEAQDADWNILRNSPSIGSVVRRRGSQWPR